MITSLEPGMLTWILETEFPLTGTLTLSEIRRPYGDDGGGG